MSQLELTLELTNAAQELLAREGYDEKYGARPLKRAIQRRILDSLALDVLNGRIRRGTHLVVDVEAGRLIFLMEEIRPTRSAGTITSRGL